MNYVFQHASRASNRRSSRTSRSNCGLCHIFLNWLMKWYISLACLYPWLHFTTILNTTVKVTTWGFWAKREAYALFCHADFILACLAQFLILFYMIQSMIRDPIRNLVRDPICNLICKLKSFLVVLGHFRNHAGLFKVVFGHFRNHSRSF